MSQDKRRFVRVTLDNGKPEIKPTLLTVVGDSPVRLSADGKFVVMLDVKENKEHFFNADRVIHIQLEDERE